MYTDVRQCTYRGACAMHQSILGGLAVGRQVFSDKG
jgi:hypothetical protein